MAPPSAQPPKCRFSASRGGFILGLKTFRASQALREEHPRPGQCSGGDPGVGARCWGGSWTRGSRDSGTGAGFAQDSSAQAEMWRPWVGKVQMAPERGLRVALPRNPESDGSQEGNPGLSLGDWLPQSRSVQWKGGIAVRLGRRAKGTVIQSHQGWGHRSESWRAAQGVSSGVHILSR